MQGDRPSLGFSYSLLALPFEITSNTRGSKRHCPCRVSGFIQVESGTRVESEFSSTPIPTTTTVDTFSIVITSKKHLLSCESPLPNVKNVFQML